MNRALGPVALCILVLTSSNIRSSSATSFVFDQPAYFATLVLVSLTALSSIYAQLLARHGPIEREESPYSPASWLPRVVERLKRACRPQSQLISDLMLIATLLLRVLVFVKTSTAQQPPWPSFTAVIPVALFILERYFTEAANLLSLFDKSALRNTSLRSNRIILLASIFAVFALVLQWSHFPPLSTHIFPSRATCLHTIAWSILGYILDVVLVLFFCKLRAGTSSHDAAPAAVASRMRRMTWILAMTSIILILGNLIRRFSIDRDRRWTTDMHSNFVIGALMMNSKVCALMCAYWITMNDIGPTPILVAISFVDVATIMISAAWQQVNSNLPSASSAFNLLLFMLLLAVFVLLEHNLGSDQALSWQTLVGRIRRDAKVSVLYSIIVICSLLYITPVLLPAHPSTLKHPIDQLMRDAQAQHKTYVAQAASSYDLVTASIEYKRRYKHSPPPGFDHWHAFAKNHLSKIIDDFDGIFDDILPFWSVSPAEIRHLTWQAIMSPESVAGLSIRDGRLFVAPGLPGTHRWMLDGMIQMIDKFSVFLPDMDIAINLNDEPRVPVPYERSQKHLSQAEAAVRRTTSSVNSFSQNRKAGWAEITEERKRTPFFHPMSWQRNFHRMSSLVCPTSSPAISNRHWQVGQHCTACASPHSIGLFLSNWTFSADICHQPDLADLHGMFLGPAAFIPSQALVPIFSQSKVRGFSDILFPSSWNYLDKATYAPNADNPDVIFGEKQPTLFWRGATTEGMSVGNHGSWRSMTRQRFVYLTSQNTSHPSSQQTVLVPHPNSEHEYMYTSISTHALAAQISTDASFVDVVRCSAEHDCPDQLSTFSPLGTSVDFQAHWKHKYLLDLDGAGFSGRFLPFLESKSLVFKAALFREWYDSRLAPWLHFVPLDLRGHGLWATLVYFAGFKDRSIKAHDEEAETIANAGREWANAVLRKEDMEVYMFRLLLEWGRLTDDNRDTIGFSTGHD